MAKGWKTAAAGTLLGLAAGAAQADVAKYAFSGEVYLLGIYDYRVSEFTPYATTDFWQGAQLSIGDHFSGVFEYDPTMARQGPTSSTQQSYLWNPLTRLAFANDAGTMGWEMMPEYQAYNLPRVTVVNHAPGAGADQFGFNPGAWDDYGSRSIVLSFTDPSGTALDSTQMPRSLSTALFPGSQLGATYYKDSEASEMVFSIRITSITEVPEPASWATLLAGCGVLGVWRRRRARA